MPMRSRLGETGSGFPKARLFDECRAETPSVKSRWRRAERRASTFFVSGPAMAARRRSLLGWIRRRCYLRRILWCRGRRAGHGLFYVPQRKSHAAAPGHDQARITIEFDAGVSVRFEQPQQLVASRRRADPQFGFPTAL